MITDQYLSHGLWGRGGAPGFETLNAPLELGAGIDLRIETLNAPLELGAEIDLRIENLCHEEQGEGPARDERETGCRDAGNPNRTPRGAGWPLRLQPLHLRSQRLEFPSIGEMSFQGGHE